MKVIIVDDENLALLKLEKLLRIQTAITVPLKVIGSFLSPYEALSAARNDVPDIAFLDIELPEISGIELAKRLRAIHPQIHIVFVTALQQLPIDAFKVNAIDCLIKPVTPPRLAVTLTKIEECWNQKAPAGAF